MNQPTGARPWRRAVGLLVAILAATAGVLAVGAVEASAATCATPGHAYLTKPGAVYFSGFDGDQRFGIPTLNTYRGDTFRLGANGVTPVSLVNFNATDRDTGAAVNLFPFGDRVSDYSFTNCVLSEMGPFTVNLPDGRYRITATYIAGNANAFVTDQVVDVVVSEANRPTPRPRPGPGPCGQLTICPSPL